MRIVRSLPLRADVGLADRDDVVLVRQVFLDAPVEVLVLDEEHRVVVADGGLEQALGVVRRRRRDDLEARAVHEHGLGVQRVVRPAVHAAAGRAAHDDRAGAADAVALVAAKLTSMS